MAIQERRTTIRRQADRELAARVKELDNRGVTPRERRRAIRHFCKAVVFERRPDGDSPAGKWRANRRRLSARVLDLSESGAAIFTTVPLAIYQPFDLRIDLYNGSRIEAEAETRWSKEKRLKRGFLCGVRFSNTDPTNQDQIGLFLLELDANLGLEPSVTADG